MRDLLLLMRAPLAATAVSNMALGAVLGGAAPDSTLALPLALLVSATCGLYWGGMVLNDTFDRERDRELAPHRPIPAGRIGAKAAAALGAGLLLVGIVCATLASVAHGAAWARGLCGALGVAACVLAYDGWLKKFRLLGSFTMASCRGSNALLGAFALGVWPLSRFEPWSPLLAYAGILLGYVFFLTILSTFEEEDASPSAVIATFLGVAAAPLAVALAPLVSPAWSPLGLVGALPLLAVTGNTLRKSLEEGTQARGHKTTITLLKGIWLLDLSVLLACCPWWLAGGLAVLFGIGTLGAKMLFKPPKKPA